MSLIINAVVGGVDSNSYGTVTEADAYFEGRFVNETSPTVQTGWYLFTEEQKVARLIQAVRIMERMRFVGIISDYEQSLQWPRIIPIINGKRYEYDIIPESIKNAQFEIAYKVYDSTGSIQSESTKIKAETLGRWSIAYTEVGIANFPSQEALLYLTPFIDDQVGLLRE